jgi:hypothetical protein
MRGSARRGAIPLHSQFRNATMIVSLPRAALGGASLFVISFGAAAEDSAPRPDEHAPAGVMFDHMHDAGEFMVGYRYAREEAGPGTRRGSHNATDAEIATGCGNSACSMAVADMRMDMHMLDLMWAPTDRFTLMVMPMWMSHEMDMRALDLPPSESEDEEGEHDGHGGHAGPHSHGTEGWGDTVFGALVRVAETPNGAAHLGLMVSAPTGAVDEMNADGTFTHYHMQLGSGTWDLVPSLTATGRAGRWSWGGQASGVVRLEDENDSGYRLGDAFEITGWGAVELTDWVSASLRLEHRKQGQIEGHYNGPHNHSSPVDVQPNYGGEFADVGLGLNLLVPRGPLAGHRLAVEWLEPVKDQPNGFQAEREGALQVGWSKAF